MINTKILWVLAGDKSKASSRVRGYWIAEELEKKDYTNTLKWRNTKYYLIQYVFLIPFYDIVIFQKTYSRYHYWLMVWANLLRKNTYLDIDDAPSRSNSPQTLVNFSEMCKIATAVFAGSPALVKFIKPSQSNVFLIPSGIKLDNYPMSSKKNEPPVKGQTCIGWIGNGKHYSDDLIQILTPPLTILAKKHPLKFKLVGSCGVKRLYNVFGNIPNLEIEFIDEIDWGDARAVSSAIKEFDIGVYPLLPNHFNSYKCGFKALEYMALGIPVIASNLDINKSIIINGETGFLVNSDQDWIEKITLLIENPKKRELIGISGNTSLKNRFSTSKITEKIYKVLKK